jgi:two-component system nitrogen regulation response regulator GlnG
VQLGIEPKRITDQALARLGHFAFPGNVRQLENICHWLTVMAPAQVIEPKDLPPEVLAASDGGPAPASAQPPATPAGMTEPTPFAALAGAVAPGVFADGGLVIQTPTSAPAAPWERSLGDEALELLVAGKPDVWDVLTRRFEARLIEAALLVTKGRRIEAAQKLGIGRNTITRKIQELGLD